MSSPVVDDEMTAWEKPVWNAIKTLTTLLQDGSEHPQGHLEIILDFYKRCWMYWILEKWDNMPVPEFVNPSDPEMYFPREIPANALVVFTSLRAVSFDGKDVLDLDRCMHISDIANILEMPLCMEVIAKVLADAIRNKSPEEIQVMRGMEGKWTLEMEQQASEDNPWLK